MTHFASGLISLWRNIEKAIETQVLIDLCALFVSFKHQSCVEVLFFSSVKVDLISLSRHFVVPNNKLKTVGV